MATPESLPSHFQILTPNSPPEEKPAHLTTIFLAGPTEVTWREPFLSFLASAANSLDGLTIYDPFQPRWDSSWREDYATDANFRAQTDWEMDRMNSATVVVVYFAERSMAPVSLLELGLVARSGRAVVGCERGFWKRGNVQAVCKRLDVPLAGTMEELVTKVVERLRV